METIHQPIYQKFTALISKYVSKDLELLKVEQLSSLKTTWYYLCPQNYCILEDNWLEV